MMTCRRLLSDMMPNFPYFFRQRALNIEQCRNAKKNIIIRTTGSNTLRISTPKWMDAAALRTWLDTHQDFVERSLSRLPETEYFDHHMPSAVFYRGRSLPVHTHKDRIVLHHADGIYLPELDRSEHKELLRRFLTDQARNILLPLLHRHAAEHHFPLGKTALTSAKTFWGVCRKQDIRLNWRLIGAPDFVCDYVCIHELCHILHPNHSPAFWQAVNTRTPYTEQAKQWLKQHGKALFAVG